MGGFSSVTGLETIVFADNASFDGTQRGGAMTTNGQLFIGSTASPHVKKGILTSPDSSITIGYSSPNITLEVAGGGSYISLSPYIVGPDAHSGFSTIAAAIAQAVTDGASVTNQKNIYIKPQSGGYTENLTLHDGINLVGFSALPSPATNFSSNDFPAVEITGTFTISTAAETKITNVWLNQSGSNNIFNITGSCILQLSGCRVDLSSGVCFSISASSPSIIIGTSTIVATSTAKMFASSTSGDFTFSVGNSILNDGGTASTIGSGTIFEDLVATYSTLGISIDATAANIAAISCNYCSLGGDGNSFISMNSGSNGSGATFTDCTLVGSGTVFASSNTCTKTFELVNCTFISTTVFQSGNFSNYTIANSNYNGNRTVNKYQITGFQGTDAISGQATLHTTSGSAQTLISIPVASGTAITLQGIISAANAAHSDMTGGSFLVMADGTAAAIVASPVLNIIPTSTGTFSASFSGGNLLIQVTAPSASAYNWVANYTYQPILTNT